LGYSLVKRSFIDHLSNSTIFPVFQKYIFGYFEKNLVAKQSYYREEKRVLGVRQGRDSLWSSRAEPSYMPGSASGEVTTFPNFVKKRLINITKFKQDLVKFQKRLGKKD
jgi:hypothetical protein